jgi:hypothetical protein
LARKGERGLPGVVVQLVRIPACHAGGRGFESRPLRQSFEKPLSRGFFVFCRPAILEAGNWPPVLNTIQRSAPRSGCADAQKHQLCIAAPTFRGTPSLGSDSRFLSGQVAFSTVRTPMAEIVSESAKFASRPSGRSELMPAK